MYISSISMSGEIDRRSRNKSEQNVVKWLFNMPTGSYQTVHELFYKYKLWMFFFLLQWSKNWLTLYFLLKAMEFCAIYFSSYGSKGKVCDFITEQKKFQFKLHST